MLKYLVDQIQIELLNIELCSVHQEWHYTNVSSPYSRLYLITKGKGYITHHGQRFELEPGNIYLIPAFSLVDMECPQYFEQYYIHFTATLPDGMNLFSLVECAYQIDIRKTSLPERLFERLLRLNPGLELTERDANKPIYESVLERCEKMNAQKSLADLMETNAILRLMISTFLRTDNKSFFKTNIEGYNRFQKVLKYIQQHLHQQITLSDMAELVDLNPAYFSSLFAKLMGIAPIDFVNRRKIEDAQHLLLSTTKPLKDIARLIGFRDVFYFSRLFKKIVGIPPAQYRHGLAVRRKRD